MNLYTIVNLMEKVGSIRFENEIEKFLFTKVAQGEMPMQPVPPPPQMGQAMGQQAGMPMMTDPSMVQQPMQQPMQAPLPPQQMANMPMPMPEETAIGESITNADIESLIKIINILTSLKSKYDNIKKDQMASLQEPEGPKV